METHNVEIEGSHLHVAETGSGPPVLLAAGFLWDAGMWAPQIEKLAINHCVVVPDMWGHGGSGPMPAGTTMQDIARQHLAMLDVLGISECTIVGSSLGGMWGAELALLAPDRVSALVLLATSLAAEPPATRRGYLDLLHIIEQHRGFPDPVIASAAPLFFSAQSGSRDPALRQRFDQRLRAWSPARVVDTVVPLGRAIFERRDAMADLSRLEMPVLVATGSDDLARSPEEGRAMAERIGCRFVEIGEAGHTVTLENPEAVNELLDDFLARVSATAGLQKA